MRTDTDQTPMNELNELSSIMLQLSSKAYIFVFIDGQLDKDRSRLENRDTTTEIKWQETDSGLVFQLKENVQMDKPIYIVHGSSSPSINSLVDHESSAKPYHHHIFLAENSSSSMTFIFANENIHQQNKNIQISIEQQTASCLHFRQIQMDAPTVNHTSLCRNVLLDRASFQALFISLGADQSQQELYVDAEGEETNIRTDSICLTKNRQHQFLKTQIVHHQGKGVSQQLCKAIANDRSKIVFNGRIKIHPHAQKVNAQQLSRSLLLSRNAEINTLPILEIDADDVKAAHGASVGELDREQIFYLQTRGISHSLSETMITQAFIQEVLDRHPPRTDNDHEESLYRSITHYIHSSKETASSIDRGEIHK